MQASDQISIFSRDRVKHKDDMKDIKDIIEDNRKLLTERDPEANKGTYGKLLVIGGSNGMAGAAYLASIAAFRTGIGMVKVLGPECNRLILQTALPEAMYSSMEAEDGSIREDALADSINWADYVIVGPGLSKGDEAVSLIRLMSGEYIGTLLRKKRMLVIDADALNIIAGSMHGNADFDGTAMFRYCSNTVITPHIGEMSRLTGLSITDIKAGQSETAEEFCRKYGVTVVLKDARTAVASRDGEQLISSGCGAMAKAGSGDVLCGFIAGITAVLGGNVQESVPLAVWLHGRAGSIAAERIGCHGILAEDIANAAPEAMNASA